MSRPYECKKCGTTMEDIEEVRLSKFEKCKDCRAFAIQCWQFAVACAGEIAERYLQIGLMNNESS
jgi:hypothetical protein